MSFDSGSPRAADAPEDVLVTVSPLTRTRRAYLAPGRLFASAEPVEVTTILGSCVAVCLFDAEAKVGGVNHFLLPEGAPATPRVAEHAVKALVERVLALGASRARLRARVFGGASVLVALRASRALGARNVEAARSLLRAAGIPIVGEAVGGEHGRRLVFAVQSGSALVRAIAPLG